MLLGTLVLAAVVSGEPAARLALRARPPFGKLSLYDGFAEAAQRLAGQAGTRRAIVVVNSETPSAGEARKVEVKVSRKGTKVRVRPAGL